MLRLLRGRSRIVHVLSPGTRVVVRAIAPAPTPRDGARDEIAPVNAPTQKVVARGVIDPTAPSDKRLNGASPTAVATARVRTLPLLVHVFTPKVDSQKRLSDYVIALRQA